MSCLLSQPAPHVLSDYLIVRPSNTLDQHDIGFGVRDTLYVDAQLLLLHLVSSAETDSTVLLIQFACIAGTHPLHFARCSTKLNFPNTRDSANAQSFQLFKEINHEKRKTSFLDNSRCANLEVTRAEEDSRW